MNEDQKPTNPKVIEVLSLLNGLTFKEIGDILYEAGNIVEMLANEKVIDTLSTVDTLKKINQSCDTQLFAEGFNEGAKEN